MFRNFRVVSRRHFAAPRAPFHARDVQWGRGRSKEVPAPRRGHVEGFNWRDKTRNLYSLPFSLP
jgi:hypothetical protein